MAAEVVVSSTGRVAANVVVSSTGRMAGNVAVNSTGRMAVNVAGGERARQCAGRSGPSRDRGRQGGARLARAVPCWLADGAGAPLSGWHVDAVRVGEGTPLENLRADRFEPARTHQPGVVSHWVAS